jgi:hypothetical protein
MGNANNSRRERLMAKQEADTNRRGGNNFSVLDTSEYPDLEFMKLEEEVEGVIDILPYEVTSKKHPNYLDMKKNNYIMEDYCLELLVHTGIGPKKRSVVCPENYENNCPICNEYRRRLDEKIQELKDDGMNKDDAWKKASQDDDIRPLKAKRRGMFIVRDKEDEDKMKILDYSAFWFLDNLRKKAKRKKVLLNDMMFDKKSVVFTPDTSTYGGKSGPGEVKDIDFEEVGTYKFKEEDIADVPKLDKMLKTYTEEEIENMLWGNVNNTDDEATDDEKEVAEEKEEEVVESPRSSRRAKRVEPEEEVVEEKSTRKRRKKTEDAEPECPEGLKFGFDIDSAKCLGDSECPMYASCDKKYDELEKAGELD